MAVLLTGGGGRLGRLLREKIDCIAPTHYELDVTDIDSCHRAIQRYEPDTVIHCAAYVDALHAEQPSERQKCWSVNVEGAHNMAFASCMRRFVYISTDYVFDGEKGNYKETDIPRPINFYGLTKLIGERIALKYRNSLVLRVPFRYGPPWKYTKAFDDQWTSCRFIGEAAADIAKVVSMDIAGLYHIGGERMSIYELAKTVSPNVQRESRKSIDMPLPCDTSLNSEKWQSLLAQ